MKDGDLVFSIEGPMKFSKHEITRRITKVVVGEDTRYRKDMLLLSDEGNVDFVEFYEDLGAGVRACVMCYIHPTDLNYVTSHAVWDKVVALLS